MTDIDSNKRLGLLIIAGGLLLAKNISKKGKKRKYLNFKYMQFSKDVV